MKPSRELDALVAEKVMGWRLEHQFKIHVVNAAPGYWVDPSTNTHWPEEMLPKFSTDIAAAFSVVEHIKGMMSGCSFSMEWDGEHWRVDFVSQNYDCYNEGPFNDSLPHAICLAALKAVGVEVP